MVTKKNRPAKVWVDKRTEFAGEFEKLSKPEGLQFYSTMKETKAAFAERTIRSLKKFANMLYLELEEYGYKYNQNLSQFFTTLNSRKKYAR